MTNGRSAWTTVGMPAGDGSPYYQLVTPENVGAAGAQPGADLSHRAVNWGVKAIQTRINELGYPTRLAVDGWLGPLTAKAITDIQKLFHITADGQAGPNTMKRLLWPYIQTALAVPPNVVHAVGGICMHESGFDPGAVGFEDPDDLGLVQINGPANPTFSEAARFDYHIAYRYCANRLVAALATYQSLDLAIASYANPEWALEWFNTGVPPNRAIAEYVAFVNAWQPGF